MEEEILTQENEEDIEEEEHSEEDEKESKPDVYEYTVKEIIRYEKLLPLDKTIYKNWRLLCIVTLLGALTAGICVTLYKEELSTGTRYLLKFIQYLMSLATGFSLSKWLSNKVDYNFDKEHLEINQTLRVGERLEKLNIDSTKYSEIINALCDKNFAMANTLLDEVEIKQASDANEEEQKGKRV